jgi:hypothetical protein
MNKLNQELSQKNSGNFFFGKTLKLFFFLSPRKLTVVHSRPGWWWSGVDRRVDQLPSATLFNYLFIKLYN